MSTPDAPLRAVGVSGALLRLEDGGVAVVDGGVWLSDEVAIERAQQLARLSTENRALKEAPTPPAPALAVALAVTAALAFALGRLTR